MPFPRPPAFVRGPDRAHTLARRERSRAAACLSVACLLVACGPAAIPERINDPFEAQNRAVHAENVALDAALLGPSAETYAGIAPAPLRRRVSRFADNVDTPRMAVNSILQGRLDDAAHSVVRFVINSTVGLAGLFDPASRIGLERRATDFGETLHVWGVGEGKYVELPLLGPSTERDAAGMVVDHFLNPLRYVLPQSERHVTLATDVLARLGDRATYGTTAESILHESADSYAQARSIYLQNRRFRLRRFEQGAGGPVETDASDGAEYFNPYEDLP